jgi:hypothetical protein
MLLPERTIKKQNTSNVQINKPDKKLKKVVLKYIFRKNR